jgi:hypothetical protein
MSSDNVPETIESRLPNQPLKPFPPRGNEAPLDVLILLAHVLVAFEHPPDDFSQGAATEGTHQAHSWKEGCP